MNNSLLEQPLDGPKIRKAFWTRHCVIQHGGWTRICEHRLDQVFFLGSNSTQSTQRPHTQVAQRCRQISLLQLDQELLRAQEHA